jgi:hypothetical protein
LSAGGFVVQSSSKFSSKAKLSRAACAVADGLFAPWPRPDFCTAQERARTAGGALVLRNEDLDRARCKPEFVSAMIEDLRWFGFEWQEEPDCGERFAPYNQSE